MKRYIRILLVAAFTVLGLVVLQPSVARAADLEMAQQAPRDITNEVNVSNIENLTGGLMFYALAACIVGIFVSASLWAMGSKGMNPGTELAGKRGMIVCVSAAFCIGAVPAWLGYLDSIAKTPDVDPYGITRNEVPLVRN